MSAKDYKICPALFKAYIAKTSKRNSNLMTEDRREITDDEIFGLIEWRLKRFCMENNTTTMCICCDDKPIIEINVVGELLDELKNEHNYE